MRRRWAFRCFIAWGVVLQGGFWHVVSWSGKGSAVGRESLGAGPTWALLGLAIYVALAAFYATTARILGKESTPQARGVLLKLALPALLLDTSALLEARPVREVLILLHLAFVRWVLFEVALLWSLIVISLALFLAPLPSEPSQPELRRGWQAMRQAFKVGHKQALRAMGLRID